MIDTKELRRLAHRHSQCALSIPVKPAAIFEPLDRLEAAEKERDNANAAAAGIALQAETLQAERDALRDKITETEKQEPVAWMLNCPTLGGDTGWTLSWTQSGAGLCNRLQGEENEKRLYTLPGAKGEEK